MTATVSRKKTRSAPSLPGKSAHAKFENRLVAGDSLDVCPRLHHPLALIQVWCAVMGSFGFVFRRNLSDHWSAIEGKARMSFNIEPRGNGSTSRGGAH